METISNKIDKIKDLLKYLPGQSFLTEIEDENIIQNFICYYISLDINEVKNKIAALFIVKLVEEKEISDIQYENIKDILKNFDELYESSTFLDNAINQLKNDTIFNNINEIFNLIVDERFYSYLAWKYIKIFGENSQNFKEFFQIIINWYFEEEIKCDFDYPYDSNYFINVQHYLANLINTENYYSLLNDNSNKQIQFPINVNAFNEKNEFTRDDKNIENKDKKTIIKEEENNNCRVDEPKIEDNNKNGNNVIKEPRTAIININSEKENIHRKDDMKEDNNVRGNYNIKHEENKYENNNIEDAKNYIGIKEAKDKENVQDANIKKKGNKRRKRNKTRALEIARKKKNQENKTKNNQNDNKDNEESEGSIEIEKNTYEECQINNVKEVIITKKEESQINNDLDKEIIIKEKDNEKIIDNNLVANLKPKENLKQYFQKMLEYYKIKNNNNNYYYLYDLATNDYFPIKTKFNFKIDFDNYPFISNMFLFLIEQLESVKDTNNHDIYKEYKGQQSFGFLILNKIEYFYVFNNEYNREIFNDINKVKEYEYENAFIWSLSSRYPTKPGKDYFQDIKSHFLTSNDFETQINRFFKNHDLKELPNYFFRLQQKRNKKHKDTSNNKSINMNYAESHYFLSFIEIDGAFAYFESSPMILIEENNKLFKVSKTINVSSWGKKINLEENNKNNFIINKNSVILLEDKLSFPNVLKNLKKDENMDKDELYSSLNFVIYKSIRKIRIIEEYLTSIFERKTTEYSYYLVLFYNNNPISDIETIIINILSNLCEQGLIKYRSFKFKVIYALPCISFNNSKEMDRMQMEMNDMKNKIEELNDMKKKIEEMNIKMKEMEKLIKDRNSKI